MRYLSLLRSLLRYALLSTSLALQAWDAGPLLWVNLQGTVLHPAEERLLRTLHPSGIVLYDQNIESAEQLRQLQDAVRFCYPPDEAPVFAADCEGGPVFRLGRLMPVPPSARALSSTGDLEFVTKVHTATGRALRCFGIDMQLGPVADVDAPDNPVIHIRSFGHDPAWVTRCTEAAVTGYQAAGLLCCLKHFPGHGRTRVDSHKALPTVEGSLEEWRLRDAPPFARLAPRVPAVMTGHLVLLCLDPLHPATHSTAVVRQLREWLGDGVILSDSLRMAGALSGGRSLGEALAFCLRAGHDILMIGGPLLHGDPLGTDPEEVCAHIAKAHAVLTSRIQSDPQIQKQVEQATRRIRKMQQSIVPCGDTTASSSLQHLLDAHAPRWVQALDVEAEPPTPAKSWVICPARYRVECQKALERVGAPIGKLSSITSAAELQGLQESGESMEVILLTYCWDHALVQRWIDSSPHRIHIVGLGLAADALKLAGWSRRVITQSPDAHSIAEGLRHIWGF